MNLKRTETVRPWWSPPNLIFRQVGSLFLAAVLTHWWKVPGWILRHSISCIPGAAGSLGMGCIGFRSHPVIELTESCNLSCIHCHAKKREGKGPELSTIEVFRLLDELAEIQEFRMVAFTGGEPLIRPDIYDILEHAKELGFSTTLASNGTLITKEVAERLSLAGLSILAVSLDAIDSETHDKIRGMTGSQRMTLSGIKEIKKAGITLHINVTIASYNEDQIQPLIRAADDLNAAILIVYQMIPVGRGADILNNALNRESNKKLIEEIAQSQRDVSVVIEPVAGPQYWAYLLKNAGIRKGRLLSGSEYLFHGCCAGRGFIYIKPDGDVLPCPFVPVSCGNVRNTHFKQIYHQSDLLKSLKDREKLEGSCGRCQYKNVCGGCRGRAYSVTGNIFAEDPACFLSEVEG